MNQNIFNIKVENSTMANNTAQDALISNLIQSTPGRTKLIEAAKDFLKCYIHFKICRRKSE